MLKALILRKKIDLKRKQLEELRTNQKKMNEQMRALESDIDSAEDLNEDIESAVNDFDKQREALQAQIDQVESDIEALNDELEEVEADQPGEPEEKPVPAPVDEQRGKSVVIDRRSEETMNTRDRLNSIVTREDVQSYLHEVRTAIKEKRALTNVGLLVPEVLLGLIRENIQNYSKLYKHVTVRRIGGTGRQLVMGVIPEAIWTECCANLNELTLAFNDLELDCFKVGGYFAVCNANLEDSDIDLAGELTTAIGQAIGLALDKAILYGRNASGTQHMPQGVVSRLVQTAAPSDYPATARAWADLHTSNVISIAASATNGLLIKSIVTASGAMKGNYSRGEKVWVMNETTYTKFMAATVGVDASGLIVAGMSDVMPVVGGVIEVLSFVPDNVIIGGYFDLYVLAERAGAQFATSEHVRFLQDQTVMKGTARYDGAPAIAEAFVAIGIEGTTPSATMTFASDTAN